MRLDVPWRVLPEQFGSWQSVYTRWRRWCERGIWKAILERLGTLESRQLRLLDATHDKVHKDSSTGGHHQTQAIGRSKGGVNTKIKALVDGLAWPVGLELAAGNCAYVSAAETVALPVGKRLVGDKGCDSDPFRQWIVAQGSTSCNPPCKNRVRKVAWHRGWSRHRHHVENFCQRIKRWRRLGTRYEKLAKRFLAFVQLVGILDWLR